MAESTANRRETPQQTWKRRGLLAAAAAAVAGFVVRVTEQPVQAGIDGDVVLGASNTTNATTFLENTSTNGTAFAASDTVGANSTGIVGDGRLHGVVGASLSDQPGVGWGVRGVAENSAHSGVWGDDMTIGSVGIGVYGSSSRGTGALGTSSSGVGVFGQIPSTSNANTVAIYGTNNSTYPGAVPGAGGFGIIGLSQNGHGLVGGTNAAGAAAIVGSSNGVTGAWAGIFYGPTIVEGNFTVISGAKSAAVLHPDGTHRRLYCVESPESWFEDFGKGRLSCGQAEVTLDPDFAAFVDVDDYHVFLTGYGDYELTVTEQTARGFRVQTRDSASANRFSWRVVAKRKDIQAPRFETVTVPQAFVTPTVAERVTPPAPPLPRPRSNRRG